MTDPLIVACSACGAQSHVTALPEVKGFRKFTASCTQCTNRLIALYDTYDGAREAWRIVNMQNKSKSEKIHSYASRILQIMEEHSFDVFTEDYGSVPALNKTCWGIVEKLAESIAELTEMDDENYGFAALEQK